MTEDGKNKDAHYGKTGSHEVRSYAPGQSASYYKRPENTYTFSGQGPSVGPISFHTSRVHGPAGGSPPKTTGDQKQKQFGTAGLAVNSGIASASAGAAVMAITGALSLAIGGAAAGALIGYMLTNEIPKNED